MLKLHKILTIILFYFAINMAFADPADMAQDILTNIIHGPINANPDLSDTNATQTVIISLRGAMITLACTTKTKDRHQLAQCVNTLKPRFLTIGLVSESAFNLGQNAAVTQAGVHFEVKSSAYPQVIKNLQIYDDNLSQKLNAVVDVY